MPLDLSAHAGRALALRWAREAIGGGVVNDDLRDALAHIAAAAKGALGATHATCYPDEAWMAELSPSPRTGRTPPSPAGLWAARGPLRDGGGVFLVEDVLADRRMDPALANHFGFRALAEVDLVHEGVVERHRPLRLGRLTCSFAEPRAFSPTDRDVILGLGQLASLALANVYERALDARRLRDAEERVSEQDALIRAATHVATANGSRSDVFNEIAAEVSRLLASDMAALVRLEDGRGVVVGAIGQGMAVGDVVSIVSGSALADLAKTARAVSISDVEELPVDSPRRPCAEKLDVRRLVASPVIVDAAVWGALIVGFATPRESLEVVEDRLTRFASLVAIEVANVEHRRDLIERSTRDPLTGLANHRAFFDRLENEVERSRRRQRPLSIAIIDLDFFKSVNDRFGHPTGDRVLVELARRLREHARGEDTLGRIGGEEFAWLMPETDVHQAITAAERVRKAVVNNPFEDVGRITLSVGIAQLKPGMDVASLRTEADNALYRAKSEGRNMTVAAGAPGTPRTPAPVHPRREPVGNPTVRRVLAFLDPDGRRRRLLARLTSVR